LTISRKQWLLPAFIPGYSGGTACGISPHSVPLKPSYIFQDDKQISTWCQGIMYTFYFFKQLLEIFYVLQVPVKIHTRELYKIKKAVFYYYLI